MFETAGNGTHVVPFVEYCHAPCVVAALLTTATPANVFADDPPATLSVASENALPRSVESTVPAGAAVSSSIAESDALLAVATGASFTAVIDVLSATFAKL